MDTQRNIPYHQFLDKLIAEYPRPVDGEQTRLYKIWAKSPPKNKKQRAKWEVERKQAIDKLGYGNIRLLIQEVTNYLFFQGRSEMGEDAISELLMKFHTEKHIFDPKRGEFKNYFRRWVRGRVRSFYEENCYLVFCPTNLQDFRRHLNKAKNYCEAENIPINEENLFKAMKIVGKDTVWAKELTPASMRKGIKRINLIQGELSLDEIMIHSDEAREYFLGDEKAQNPSIESERQDLMELVRNQVDSLPPREREVIKRRFGIFPYQDEEELETIGKSNKVTKERIRQIQNKALIKLKKAISKINP